MVKQYIPNANTILDVGCGSCCTTKQLEMEGKKIVSLDIVDQGKCKKPQLFNGRKIPYPEQSFDLGICSFVLHHTSDQDLLLQELKRTCRSILILEDTPIHPSEWYYVQQHAQSDWGKCKDCFKPIAAWKSLFESLGFHIKHQKTLSRWLCPFSYKPYFYPVTSSVFVLEHS